MPKSGRKRADRRPVETAHPEPHPVEKHGRGTAIALAGIVIVVILAIVGFIAYPIYYAPFHKNIITVDDTSIRMDYFIKRMKASGSDPLGLLTSLTNDLIIRKGAPQYGITLSGADIDDTLRAIYQGQSDNATAFSESEFNEWYRQRLNESGFSDTEYREIIATEIYRSRLQEYLVVRMPAVAEHIHLYTIVVEKENEAQTVLERLAKGEKFTDLAKELSLDRSTGDNGGEVGWFPEGGVLTSRIEFEAFALATGNVSQPIPIINEQEQPEGGSTPAIIAWQLLLVTERGDRELDPNALRILQSQVVDKWLTTERANHTVKWQGLNDTFDSETYAWLNYQVAKSKPASPAGENQQPSP
jgi:hypothetical protein